MPIEVLQETPDCRPHCNLLEMASTTPEYDYSYTMVTPCDPTNDNNFGSKLSVLFYFMFLFSFLGNGLVLLIIYRFERLTTVTNILLLNLVISCLLFMSSLPLQGIYLQLTEWVFGEAMCKIYGCLYFLGLYSSVLFLTLLTFDRHLAVVYSLSASRLRSRRYAMVSCLVVWLVSMLACLNHLLVHGTYVHYDNKTYCDEVPLDIPHLDEDLLQSVTFYTQIFLFLLFPLVVIIYCYVRIAITVISSRLASKFKTVRLIFVIVMLFFICWTPFNMVELLRDSDTSCEGQERWGYATHVTRNLTSLYFCICPIFYTFVGRKFQNYFRQLLVRRFPALRRHISISQSRNTGSTKTTPNDL